MIVYLKSIRNLFPTNLVSGFQTTIGLEHFGICTNLIGQPLLTVQFHDIYQRATRSEHQSHETDDANDHVLQGHPISWTETNVPVRYSFDEHWDQQS